MKVLGISAFYHDSAVSIISNGEIIAAAQEERFTRIKNDSSFPKKAIEYCLKESGFTIDELDAVVFYDKPLLKFERLLETYYQFAPKGLLSFLKAMPVWLKEKLFLKKIIRDELSTIEKFDRNKIKLLFPEHHLSHAASAFFPSSFQEAAILTIDGVGEWATASIAVGEGNAIRILKEMHFPNSLGLLYSAFTYFLGFKVNSGEYKLMGLAPYGNPNAESTGKYIQIIKEKLVSIMEDGSIWLNQEYFKYGYGLTMVDEKKWAKLFNVPFRTPESQIEQSHCDLAYAIQYVTEEIVIRLAREAKRITGSDNLCMAGGVALNCVANGKLQRENIFKNIFIQPASGDSGGSLGAALAAYHIYFGKDRIIDPREMDKMKGTYLGPSFSGLDITYSVKRYRAIYKEYVSRDDLNKEVAKLISEGMVVGWFQGRMEFGPRALGARSILADPRNPEMQKKLNLKIKYREGFRPFAPAVLAEDATQYFVMESPSPYMMMVQTIQEKRKFKVSDQYSELKMWDKLYQLRSDLPAITHVDYSARIQTVHKETNPSFYSLISEFKKLTQCGVLINTSFNIRGEPIVCTPDNAYNCFMNTEMDYLVIENFLFRKVDQPLWEKKTDMKTNITD